MISPWRILGMMQSAFLILSYLAVFLPALFGLFWAMDKIAD